MGGGSDILPVLYLLLIFKFFRLLNKMIFHVIAAVSLPVISELKELEGEHQLH